MIIIENKPIISISTNTSINASIIQSRGINYKGSSEVTMPIFSIEIITINATTPIPNTNYKLRHSLSAESLITKDGFIIRSSYVDEEAYGNTYSEAYLDFLSSIYDRYQSLSCRKKPLSEFEQEILKRLRTLLEPN